MSEALNKVPETVPWTRRPFLSVLSVIGSVLLHQTTRVLKIMALSAGRILISLSTIFISVGAYIADYNETHVLNPRWPPHARFHNGQTMTLGVLLCAACMYFLWRPKARSGARDLERDDLLSAALIGSMYTAAGLSAILYPGTDWNDPEFIARGDPVRANMWLFMGDLGAVWVGFGLEMARLNGSQVNGKAQ